MSDSKTNNSLTKIIDQIADMSENEDQVSVDDIVSVIGRRAFGPFLVFIGLFLVVPGVSDIPGVPILCGLLVILLLSQQLLGRDSIWLPAFLLRRSVDNSYIEKSLEYARKPAQTIDSLTSSRLTFLVNNETSHYFSAIVCILAALITPLTTFIPFSANVVGLCFLLFGLAFVTRDGIIMLLAYASFIGIGALLGINFL
jgi:hypothetical protein